MSHARATGARRPGRPMAAGHRVWRLAAWALAQTAAAHAPLLAALLASVALAANSGCERATTPRFPHREHLVAVDCGSDGKPECPSCASCHSGIRTADERATDPPSECGPCHRPATDSVRAEVQRLERVVRAPPRLSFDHPTHLPLPELAGQCVGCHPGAVDDGASGAVFPTMAQCLECHRHDDEFSRGDCLACHLRDDLRTRVPRTVLRHDLSFLRDHRSEVASRSAACAHCHEQRECLACHESGQTIAYASRRPDAVDRELIHRGDYLARHAIEARSTPSRCVRCHDSSSCDGCHVRHGVSAARVGASSPHPAGWIGSNPTAPTFHGRVARRELVSCAGCHDRGPATHCIRCHRVGGFGGNPHPSGWTSSRSTGDGMCRYCHEP